MSIVDRFGKPLNMQHNRRSAYFRHGASYAKKPLASWVTSGASADEDIGLTLETLRDRSRDLFMGSSLAAGAVRTVRTNVVGSGLRANCHIDRDLLGLTEEQAREWEKNTEREWRLWATTPACDASRSMNFYQLQALVLMSALMSGDCFAALPYIKRPGEPYSLKVFLIEGDRICNPAWITESATTLQGVETDLYGQPVAYWVSRYNPRGALRRQGKPQEWKRVPAFGARTGRRNLLHILPERERPGQRRGVPFLAPVIEDLKQLSRYTEAELQAAVVSGLFTGFVTTPSGDGLGGFPGDEKGADDAPVLGSGTIAYLAEGQSISFGTPGRPNSAFEKFVEAICRQIGAALELPYELLIKHFTASYSASRASLLEAWKSFRARRRWLIDDFCRPVFTEWLSEAVTQGRVEAPGFFDDPALKVAWSRTEWAGDAQGQLDPLKEVDAAIARIDAGLSTREREAAELTGMSPDVIIPQLGREKTMMEEQGLGVTAQRPVRTENNDDSEKQNS